MFLENISCVFLHPQTGCLGVNIHILIDAHVSVNLLLHSSGKTIEIAVGEGKHFVWFSYSVTARLAPDSR